MVDVRAMAHIFTERLFSRVFCKCRNYENIRTYLVLLIKFMTFPYGPEIANAYKKGDRDRIFATKRKLQPYLRKKECAKTRPIPEKEQ